MLIVLAKAELADLLRNGWLMMDGRWVVPGSKDVIALDDGSVEAPWSAFADGVPSEPLAIEVELETLLACLDLESTRDRWRVADRANRCGRHGLAAILRSDERMERCTGCGGIDLARNGRKVESERRTLWRCRRCSE